MKKDQIYKFCKLNYPLQPTLKATTSSVWDDLTEPHTASAKNWK